MVKKSTKKTSVKRRISARPLGFWQFIRKNFLIISGLLLLPVTVGAVVSSYNYANQGSAAGRRNTLRTQIVEQFSCPSPNTAGGPCRSLTDPGKCVPVDSCVQRPDKEGQWCRCLGYQSNKKNDYDYQCGLGPGCQNPTGIPTPAPTSVSNASSSGNCNNPSGNNGEWRPCEGNLGQGSNTGRTSYNCVNGRWVPHEFDSNCTRSTNEGQQPTSPPPTPVPQASNKCTGNPSYESCYGKDIGSKIPLEHDNKTNMNKYCVCTKQGENANGPICGCLETGVWEQSAGFDVKKAIKNFFGIFGF